MKRKTLIDLSPFVSLEEFWVSKHGFDATPEKAASVFLAPKLRKFTWDFGVHDQHTESWSDFGVDEEKWILDFAKVAAARGSALEEFRIQFQPDAWHGHGSLEALEAEGGYPWDRMDAMKDSMSARGIALTYHPPPIYSKEEVRRNIMELEEEDKRSEVAESELSQASTEP